MKPNVLFTSQAFLLHNHFYSRLNTCKSCS